MGQIASAAKQQRKAMKHRLRNVAAMSALRTAIRKARNALGVGAPDSSALVHHAISVIDSAVTRGILKRKTASRYVSRLARRNARAVPLPARATSTTSALELTASQAMPTTHAELVTAESQLRAVCPPGDPKQRTTFLDAARILLCKELRTTMRPSGSGAIANNRMGAFTRAVNVGVVALADEIRVHIHTKDVNRQARFRDIARELRTGLLIQPPNLVFDVRAAPRAADLLYFEASWRPSDFATEDLSRVEAAAALLSSIRPRI